MKKVTPLQGANHGVDDLLMVSEAIYSTDHA
jgi:hypothetical protein